MLKKLMLAAIVLCGFGVSAHAACPTSLELQDANGIKAAAQYTDNGSGLCQVNTLDNSVLSAVNAPIAAQTNVPPNLIGAISNDPCSYNLKTNVSFSSAALSQLLVSGSGTKKVFVCSLTLVAGGATNISLIEGTGTSCTSANEFAIMGSTVASSGMALTTNGTLQLGGGGSSIGLTSTASNGICFIQPASATLAGNITFVQQ